MYSSKIFFLHVILLPLYPLNVKKNIYIYMSEVKVKNMYKGRKLTHSCSRNIYFHTERFKFRTTAVP